MKKANKPEIRKSQTLYYKASLFFNEEEIIGVNIISELEPKTK